MSEPLKPCPREYPERLADYLRQIAVHGPVYEDDDQGPFLTVGDAEVLASAALEWMKDQQRIVEGLIRTIRRVDR